MGSRNIGATLPPIILSSIVEDRDGGTKGRRSSRVRMIDGNTGQTGRRSGRVCDMKGEGLVVFVVCCVECVVCCVV